MSEDIELGENEFNYRRDSFSDRFCDDLTEVMLQFLPIEDKLRLESVSHQFQRCVFAKECDLEIVKEFYYSPHFITSDYRYVIKENFILKFTQCLGHLAIHLKAFESLLKKYKFIKKIVIKTEVNIANSDKVLALITEYVTKLKSISMCSSFSVSQFMKEKTLLEFRQKFGSNLESIDFQRRIFPSETSLRKPFLRLCPNIKASSHIRLNDFIDSNELLLFPKLMSIQKLYLYLEDIHLMQSFANQFKNRLKCLGLLLMTEGMDDMNGEIPNVGFLQVFSAFGSDFPNIAINCNKIKKMYFSYRFITVQSVQQFAQSLRFCPQLKQLKTYFISHFTINLFKNCKNLTHLCVDKDYWMSYDNQFNGIDIYLPQLTHLCIKDTNSMSDSVLELVAKLKHLKCLIIRKPEESFDLIIDTSLLQIITNCPQIKSIHFNRKPNITHKTIDALISLAEEKPFRDFVYSFGPKPEKSEEDFDYLYFISNQKYEMESLPKNLRITPLDIDLIYWSESQQWIEEIDVYWD